MKEVARGQAKKIQHTHRHTTTAATIVLLKPVLSSSMFFSRSGLENLIFRAAHPLERFTPTHDTNRLKTPNEHLNGFKKQIVLCTAGTILL
jgi:hypothetical protein